MPHAKLGEEVAAAVVLREGAACDEHELRDFAAARLAPFKVPRKIVFLTEIPKGATGKLQRIGLAEKLGLIRHEGRDLRRRRDRRLARASKLAAGRRRRDLHRARPASGGDAGERRDAAQRRRDDHRASALRRRRRPRPGAQDYVIVTLKAHALPGAAPQIAAHDGAGQRAGHRHQRRALLVFLRPRRPVARPPRRKRRSRRHAVGHRCRRRRRSAAWSIPPPKWSRPA